MDGSSVRLLGKNNMHCRPQTAGGTTPSPRGNLRAFCSVFCLLFLLSSFSCPHGVFSSQMHNCHNVFFLLFFTSSSRSSLSLSKFTHFLCLPLQSAFSRPSLCYPHHHHHTPLAWLPSLFSSQLPFAHLSTLHISY